MADVNPNSSRNRQWSFATGGRLAGMCVARESRHTLAWDDAGVLYLLNATGRVLVHVQSPDALAGAAISGDGNIIVALSTGGKLSWLDASLEVRRSDRIRYDPLNVALDSRGWYAVVSAKNARAAVLDCHGRHIGTIRSARPLTQMIFLTQSTGLMVASEQGLVAQFELRGQARWQKNIATRLGALGIDDSGELIVVAAFAQGLIRYGHRGRPLGSLHTVEMPSRVSLSADGRCMLVASLSQQISLISSDGEVLWEQAIGTTAVEVVLDALARSAWCGTEDGQIVCYDLSHVDRG